MANWGQSIPALPTLIAFEAAYRHGNFTRAAEELHYSQATVSRRIAALEADLGTTLFERGRHDVSPTAEAALLAQAVRSALTELSATTKNLRRMSSDPNRLTIRSDVSLTSAAINPVIGDIQQQYPELDIRVLSSFEPIESSDEDFDLGLQYARDRQSDYIVDVVASDEVFPVCSPELAETLPLDLSAEALANLPLLHVDYGEPAWVDWSRFLEAIGIDTPGELEGPIFTTYLVCLDLAERGQGVALGWGHTAQPRIDAGRLVRIPGFTLPIPDAIRAYRPPTATPWEPVDYLLSSLRAHLAPPAG